MDRAGGCLLINVIMEMRHKSNPKKKEKKGYWSGWEKCCCSQSGRTFWGINISLSWTEHRQSEHKSVVFVDDGLRFLTWSFLPNYADEQLHQITRQLLASVYGRLLVSSVLAIVLRWIKFILSIHEGIRKWWTIKRTIKASFMITLSAILSSLLRSQNTLHTGICLNL